MELTTNQQRYSASPVYLTVRFVSEIARTGCGEGVGAGSSTPTVAAGFITGVGSGRGGGAETIA
jgi:hypothetical protein